MFKLKAYEYLIKILREDELIISFLNYNENGWSEMLLI